MWVVFSLTRKKHGVSEMVKEEKEEGCFLLEKDTLAVFYETFMCACGILKKGVLILFVSNLLLLSVKWFKMDESLTLPRSCINHHG